MGKLCIGVTLTGMRCGREALPKANYCAIHAPDSISRASMKKAAKKVAMKKAVKRAAKK
jgi:hypothetical protein